MLPWADWLMSNALLATRLDIPPLRPFQCSSTQQIVYTHTWHTATVGTVHQNPISTMLTFGLGTLFYVTLLLVNAVAILTKERFLLKGKPCLIFITARLACFLASR
jgi:hypothetical protein